MDNNTSLATAAPSSLALDLSALGQQAQQNTGLGSALLAKSGYFIPPAIDFPAIKISNLSPKAGIDWIESDFSVFAPNIIVAVKGILISAQQGFIQYAQENGKTEKQPPICKTIGGFTSDGTFLASEAPIPVVSTWYPTQYQKDPDAVPQPSRAVGLINPVGKKLASGAVTTCQDCISAGHHLGCAISPQVLFLITHAKRQEKSGASGRAVVSKWIPITELTNTENTPCVSSPPIIQLQMSGTVIFSKLNDPKDPRALSCPVGGDEVTAPFTTPVGAKLLRAYLDDLHSAGFSYDVVPSPENGYIGTLFPVVTELYKTDLTVAVGQIKSVFTFRMDSELDSQAQAKEFVQGFGIYLKAVQEKAAARGMSSPYQNITDQPNIMSPDLAKSYFATQPTPNSKAASAQIPNLLNNHASSPAIEVEASSATTVDTVDIFK